MRPRTTIAATGAALAVAAGAGGALAADPGRPGGVHAPPGGAAIASYLGLTEAQLRAQLEVGKSLAEVAAAQGKSVAGLESVMLADAKAHLDQAVADGKLTVAQEQTMLADLKARIDDIVNRTGPPAGRPGPGGPHFGAATASYLGLTEAQLRTELQAGKSLAQIATAQGKSVSGLEAAILAGAKTQLDRRSPPES
jgi:hypothetical protein